MPFRNDSLPEEHNADENHDDEQLGEREHDEAIDEVHKVGNREDKVVFTPEERVMQFDLRLEVLDRDHVGFHALSCLISLVRQVPDE